MGAHAVPGRDKLFVNRPCALLGTSARMGGTIQALLAFRRSLQLNVVLSMPQPEVFVIGTRARFDATETLTGADAKAFVARFIRAFAEWSSHFGPARRGRRPALPLKTGGPARTA